MGIGGHRMSEVEKMYENAEIRPNYIDACTVEDKYWQNEELANEYGTFDMYMNAKCGHQEDCTTLCSCAYTKEEYPPFTAEKQILLLQWLLDKTDLYLHRHKTDFTYSIASGDIAVNKYKDFKESIAEFINTLWQDLTEQERTEIADILKG